MIRSENRGVTGRAFKLGSFIAFHSRDRRHRSLNEIRGTVGPKLEAGDPNALNNTSSRERRGVVARWKRSSVFKHYKVAAFTSHLRYDRMAANAWRWLQIFNRRRLTHLFGEILSAFCSAEQLYYSDGCNFLVSFTACCGPSRYGCAWKASFGAHTEKCNFVRFAWNWVEWLY